MLPYLMTAGAAALALAFWFARRRTLQVPCELDLERTHDHLHAHVTLRGVAVQPGDAVLVQGAPARLDFGEQRTVRTSATVRQASGLRRWWTRVWGIREFYELYDVGFEG
jgi:hypothetical protein